jgi:hypothetical protein
MNQDLAIKRLCLLESAGVVMLNRKLERLLKRQETHDENRTRFVMPALGLLRRRGRDRVAPDVRERCESLGSRRPGVPDRDRAVFHLQAEMEWQALAQTEWNVAELDYLFVENADDLTLELAADHRLSIRWTQSPEMAIITPQ